jgi:AraC-like DNA-binding protein
VAQVEVDRSRAPAFGLADELAPFGPAPHAHAKHQILYVSAGTLHLEVGRLQWVLPPQRAAFIRAGVEHAVSARGPVSLRTVYLAPRLTCGPEEDCRVFPVGGLARELLLEAMRWGPDHDPRAPLPRAFFRALTALCEEWTAAALPLRLPTARTPELRTAMQLTLEGLDTPLAIETIARASGMSVRTLSRRFSDETGTSWRSFLRAARMMRAMELLSVPGARVTEVGLEVGFESPSAFSRAFEQFAGEPPRDFRRRHAGHEAARGRAQRSASTRP